MFTRFSNKIAILIMVIYPLIGQAYAGAGSGGGGSGLTEEGQLKLRDFVEGISCEWTDGATFFRQPLYSHFKYLNTISFITRFIIEDEIFGAQIENEAVRTKVCMSLKPLRSLPETVLEAVTVYNATGASPVQIGIRVDNDIFIDQKAFESLDEESQGYFLFHELMHGLIPMETPARMTKLRDFVARFKALRKEMPERLNDIIGDKILQKPETLKKLSDWKTNFMQMKYQSGITSKSVISREEAIDLLGRYRDLGHVYPTKVIFGWGLNPNDIGISGKSLFHELIWEGRDCDVNDSRPLCQQLTNLTSMYLIAGADPDTLFDNREGWKTRPVWEYLLSSYAQHGKIRRLELAEQIFNKLHSKASDNQSKANLKERLNLLLLEMSRNPYLDLAVQKLVEFGADVNTLDKQGNSALMLAAGGGAGNSASSARAEPPARMVVKLVKAGANIQLKNNEGLTAFDILESQRESLTSEATQVKLFNIASDLLKNGGANLESAEQELLELGR